MPDPSGTQTQSQYAADIAAGQAAADSGTADGGPQEGDTFEKDGYVWEYVSVTDKNPSIGPDGKITYATRLVPQVIGPARDKSGGTSSAAAMLQAEKASTPEERLRLAELARDTQRADTAAREQGSLYDTQATLGSKLLDQLVKLTEDPAAGPLGLLAYGSYGGGAQNIATGTGGAGIKSPYSSLLDQLLGHLSAPVTQSGSLFNSIGGGQSGTEKIKPNVAPTMNPENAAAAPDARQSLIDAWNAFHPDQPYQDPNAQPAAQPTPTPVPAFFGGGSIPVRSDGMLDTSHPEYQKRSEAILQSPIARILARAKTLYTGAGGAEPDFDRIVSNALQSHVQANAAAAVGTPQPPMPAAYGGASMAGAAPVSAPRADGGGVTLGGQPHYITDSGGKVVATLTEDGKPETVNGVGGVEVTPEDPIRKAAYLARKDSMKRMGQMLADLATPATPVAAATGATALFPIPSFGGDTETRAQQVGDYFKSVQDPTTHEWSMPSEATDNQSANDVVGYAKMLGGALSAGNTAINADTLKELNAGKAPSKLFSAEEYATLLPSQRQGYLALLQQMGLGSPKDIEAQIKAGTPDALK